VASVVTGTALSVVVDVALMAARVSSKGLSWPLQLSRQQDEARRNVKPRIVEVAPGKVSNQHWNKG